MRLHFLEHHKVNIKCVNQNHSHQATLAPIRQSGHGSACTRQSNYNFICNVVSTQPFRVFDIAQIRHRELRYIEATDQVRAQQRLYEGSLNCVLIYAIIS